MRLTTLALISTLTACVTETQDQGTDYGDDAKADSASAIKYPAGISPRTAREMRTLVKAAAKQPWSCQFNAVMPSGKTASASNLDYTLAVHSVDLGGPEADTRRDYAVSFDSMDPIPNPDSPSDPIEATREMIVGYISFVNPELEKIKTDDGKTGYNYTFGGAIFDDSLQVVANGTGGAASIVYEKSTHGNIVMQIGCTPKS